MVKGIETNSSGGPASSLLPHGWGEATLQREALGPHDGLGRGHGLPDHLVGLPLAQATVPTVGIQATQLKLRGRKESAVTIHSTNHQHTSHTAQTREGDVTKTFTIMM